MVNEIDFLDIAFLPIDLPKIPNKENIVANFDKEFKYGWWDAIRLFEPTVDFNPTNLWSNDAIEKFPELKQWMIDNIPFTDYIHSKIMKSKDVVEPHVDYRDPSRRPDVYKHLNENEPSSYRLVIFGKREDSVYLCKDFDSPKENRVYPILPEDTDVYAMPYTDQVHGVDFESNRIIVITNGYINIEKHQAILKRSLEKYKDYLVRRSDLK
tara:strand:+ start:1268 stop:1900 length:633 start_codon:yes stop_codon:yes gene_type:complete